MSTTSSSSSSDSLGPDDFYKVCKLGQGHQGKVYLVQRRGTRQLYAMKIVSKKDLVRNGKVSRVLTERELLKSADHPFVTTMYHSFQSKKALYLVMEYCSGGDLFELQRKQPENRFDEATARFYAAEILIGLEYLHVIGFMYRDIKAENVMVQANGHISLGDFDLAVQMKEPAGGLRLDSTGHTVDSGNSLFRTKSFLGTVEYMAPEVLAGSGYGESIEWWSFGILVYRMLTGKTPFHDGDMDTMLRRIHSHEKVKFPSDVKMSKTVKSFILKLVEPDVRKRMTLEKIRAHKWFKDIDWALIRNQKAPIVPEAPKIKMGSKERIADDLLDSSDEDGETSVFGKFGWRSRETPPPSPHIDGTPGSRSVSPLNSAGDNSDDNDSDGSDSDSDESDDDSDSDVSDDDSDSDDETSS